MSKIIPMRNKRTHLVRVSGHPSVTANIAFYYADEDHVVAIAYAHDGDLIGRLYVRPDGSLLMSDDDNAEPGLLLYAIPLHGMDHAACGLLEMLWNNGFVA